MPDVFTVFLNKDDDDDDDDLQQSVGRDDGRGGGGQGDSTKDLCIIAESDRNG